MRHCHPWRVAVIIAVAATLPHSTAAQVAGPVTLLLPVSARLASQGNAGVAARDDYAIFYNPAMIGAASGIGLTVTSWARNARTVALAAGTTVGSVTFGWGVHIADLSEPGFGAAYPIAPAALRIAGDAGATSTVAVLGGQGTWKRFRIGLAAKYAQDVVPHTTSAFIVAPSRGSAFLADIGAAHALWTGTAGLAIQNIGHPYRLGDARYTVPTQAALGWTGSDQWGPLDLSYTTQVLARRGGWVSPAGGVEVGWSWIEGYAIAGRVGARRPETAAERPVELGASFNADRLSLDYGVTLFDQHTSVHYVSLRWK